MPRRQSIRRRRRQTPLVVALYLNAGLLACIVLALVSRGSGSTAYAAPMEGQPVAGGNGLYLMPAQFAVNVWGCYVMDTDRQTLCAYEYIAGRKQLQLVAARFFGHDRQLTEYNTSPPPEEVLRWVNLQKAPIRGQPQDGVERVGPEIDNIKPPTQPGSPQGPESPGGRPLGRPPQPGDPDYVPSVKDINNPPPEGEREE